MKIDLSDRTAMVTGSTAGIGPATAEGLGRAGVSAIINGRTQARVDEARQQKRAAFPQATISGIAADLATADGTNAFIAPASDADILVKNVGTAFLRDVNGIDDIAAIADEDWLGLIQLNVMSGVRLSRHYLPSMVGKGWGRAIFVSSESAVKISPARYAQRDAATLHARVGRRAVSGISVLVP